MFKTSNTRFFYYIKTMSIELLSYFMQPIEYQDLPQTITVFIKLGFNVSVY